MGDNFEITDVKIGDVIYYKHPMGTQMGPFNVCKIDIEHNCVIDTFDGNLTYSIPFKMVVRIYREDELIWRKDYKNMQTE